MKFQHELTMKAKVLKSSLKNGIERDKGMFDCLDNGEEKVISRDEIIGKRGNGKHFVRLITGYEYFKEK